MLCPIFESSELLCLRVNSSISGTFMAVQRLRLHSRGYGFDPWSGNEDPICCGVAKKYLKNSSSISGQKVSTIMFIT